MGKGQTFLADDKTPRGVVKHLRIVISDPMEFGEDKTPQCLVVNVTSWYDYVWSQDDACVLEAGCHPFIKHKSWIDYSRSVPMTLDKISNGLKSRLFIPKADMSSNIIARIQDGARLSDNFPEELERFFDAF